MKPLVVHLIGDKLPGGSNLYVERLVNSLLQEKYHFLVTTFAEFRLLVQEQKPDLIISHYPCKWQHLWQLITLRHYAKLIILDHHYCQGFELDSVSNKWRFHLMLKLAYAIADRVICVSQAQKEWMLSRSLVEPDKVSVIPISVSGAAAIEDLLKIPPKKLGKPLILGAYGRFAYQKGFDILLKAIALLPRKDFFLYLGGYGFEANTLQELASNLPNVKLVGAVNNVSNFLAMCDAIVIPSRWETGSIVCLEAKAAAKPIVASDIDTFPALVGKSGLLVPPNNIQALANAIADLPKQDLLGWGQAARQSTLGSWQRFLTNWENLLQEILS